MMIFNVKQWLRYIDSFEGSMIAFILFSIGVIVLPYYGPADDVELILTVSTFLFAILTGFFISRQSNRYDKLRELVAQQDASWLSFYRTVTLLDKPLAKKMIPLIDEYYRIWFDLEIGANSYKMHRPLMNTFFTTLDQYNSESNHLDIYDELVALLIDLEEQHNEESILSLEKMSLGQWLVLSILAAIILFSLFFLRIDALHSGFITILLSTVLVTILLILRDLQNLMHGGQEYDDRIWTRSI